MSSQNTPLTPGQQEALLHAYRFADDDMRVPFQTHTLIQAGVADDNGDGSMTLRPEAVRELLAMYRNSGAGA